MTTITVMSPHRDDAAFSVGLTIGIWLNLGHQVEVVNCFTKSTYGPFSGFTSTDAEELQQQVTELRRQEDLYWSSMYTGPLSVTDLDLADAPQRLQCSVTQVCSTAVNPSDPAIAMMCAGLMRRQTHALVLPLGIGDHVDHLATRVAGQSALFSSLPLAFYEDLPYSARPCAAVDIRARANRVAAGLEPRFAIAEADVTTAIERKRKLALCYSSQVDRAVTDQIASFCGQYGGRERLWVNQAWRDAGSWVAC